MDDGSNGEEGAVDIPSETETFDSYTSNEAASPVIGKTAAPAPVGSPEATGEEAFAASTPRASVDEDIKVEEEEEEDTSYEHGEDENGATPNGRILDTTVDTQDSDTTVHNTDVDTEEDHPHKSDEKPEIVADEDDTSAHTAIEEQQEEEEPKVNGDHHSFLDTSEERGEEAEEDEEDRQKQKEEQEDPKDKEDDNEIDEEEEERLLNDADDDDEDDEGGDEGEAEDFNNDSNSNSNSTSSSSSSSSEDESDALVIDESSGLPASKDKRRRPPSSTSATATKSPPAVKEIRSPTPEKVCGEDDDENDEEKSAEKSHLSLSPKQTPPPTQEEVVPPPPLTPALPPPFSSSAAPPPLTPHHHYNPYFNESLFELSQQHHPGLIATAVTTTDCASPPTTTAPLNNNQRWQDHQIGGIRNNNNILNNINKRMKNNYKVSASGPKLLNEYHQYLGLQPSVQFKCSRCGQAGFESLTTLNRHIVQCTEEQPLSSSTSNQPQNNNNQSSSSSFKLTRKVFLCSACGTYYENWNLFLHMVEVHRRYLCLYCLGMFSALNDLCNHIQNRHNLEPGHKDTPQEFYSAYSDPCYVVCCDCGAGFSEQDNFFYHACARKLAANNNAGTNVNNNNSRTLLHNNIIAGSNQQPQQQQRTFGLLGHSVVNNNLMNKGLLNNKPASVGVRQQIRPENHVTGDSSLGCATATVDATTTATAVGVANRTNVEDNKPQQNNHQKVTAVSRETPSDVKSRRRRRRQRSVMESLTESFVPAAASSERREDRRPTIEQDLDVTLESNERLERQIGSSDSEIEDFKGYTSDGQPVHFERRLSNKSYEHVEPEEEAEEEEAEEDNRLTSSREDAVSSAVPPPPLRDDEPMEIDDPPAAVDDEVFDEGPVDSDDNGYVEEDGEEEEEDEEAAEEEEVEDEQPEPVVETRKVPKLSLKLKPGAFPEIEQHRSSGDDYEEEPDEEDEESDNNQTQNDDLEDQLLESETEQKEEQHNASTTDNDAEICNEDDQQAQTETTEEPILEEDKDEDSIRVAGPDVNIVELELEQPLDKFDIRLLLQKCLKATTATCIYCNHARKIAVNGKQLGLHAIAEHRFSAVVSSITAEELIPESFVAKIKEHLPSLDEVFFSLESSLSADEGVTFSHVFECFQCRYATTVHKELYLHNRKLHAKNLLLCIMCKSGFYSYSELICHLCPGVYILGYDLQFRCCMCVGDDLPSAFRLMVHLRKRHHCCDVCLEMCHSQAKLSNHVWKHKLHHFCYRCCITYRNKPDITRHLFWKHGTESVMCKKCLQKKWPHVYHFCVPPTSFTCDECQLIFTKAVTLKVHKRLHTDEKPHACTIDDCKERFISKKLLAKHEYRHREPPEEEKEIIEIVEDVEEANDNKDKDCHEESKENKDGVDNEEKAAVEEKEKVKPKVDVYDLPELNLSESDSSDSEDEAKKEQPAAATTTADASSSNEQRLEKSAVGEPPIVVDNMLLDSVGTIDQSDAAVDGAGPTLAMNIDEDISSQANDGTGSQVVLNIWDNFKTYQANKEKFGSLLTEAEKTDDASAPEPLSQQEQEDLTLEVIMRDHDYCINPENEPADITFTEVKPDLSQSVDHDYCFAKEPAAEAAETPSTQDKPEEPVIAETSEESAAQPKSSPKKSQNNSSSSDSSSDSDSSSCSCGPNCSCSSSSGSSSSTSDSSNSDSSTEEGRKRQQLRREKRKQKKNKEQKNDKAANKTNQQANVTVSVQQPPQVRQPVIVAESPIEETDLETTESETDEEFYDKQPQKLAQQLLEEKRKQLVMAGVLAEPTPNGTLSRPATPNLPPGEDTTEAKPRKKSKSKKKKKRKSERREQQLQSSLEETNRNNDDEDDTVTSNIPSYYQPFYHHHQQHQPATPTVPPVTLTLARSSPIQQTPTISIKLPKTESQLAATTSMTGVELSRGDDSNSSEMSNLRASKRRRVPNKFYGYSSDEDDAPSATKWRKTESQYEPQHHQYQQQQQQPQMMASSSSQQHTSYTSAMATMVAPSRVVPPLTIKAVMPSSPAIATAGAPMHHYNQPRVQPFSIRATPIHPSSRMRALQHQPSMAGGSNSNNRRMPPIKLKTPKQNHHHNVMQGHHMESEEEGSNDSSNEGRNNMLPAVDPTALYCYCKCPYDEVSEMIGCDADDCEIEWFHFECVGIMVPPKGHWFCPECRKKRHQRRGEMTKVRPKAAQAIL